jgi:HK97 family phage major capsid protein
MPDVNINLEELKTQLASHKKNVEDAVAANIAAQSTAADAKVTELKAELDKVNTTLAALEKEIKQQKHHGIDGGRAEDYKKNFSWSAYIGALLKMKQGLGADVAFKEAGPELEFLKSWSEDRAKTKAANSTDGTDGAYLVGPEAQGELIDMAIADMPTMEMGPSVFRNLTGSELPIPKLTARPTGYWVAETGAPTESSATFGEIKLMPKKVAAFTKISRRLVYQTRGAADQIIKTALSQAMALKLDEGLLIGSGSVGQPLGLLNATGMTASNNVVTSSAVGGRFRIDKAAEMAMNIDVANELKNTGSFGFLMRPEVMWGMKRERVLQYSGQSESTALPALPMNLLMTNALLEQQMGYRFRTTTTISKDSNGLSTVLFGNFKLFYVAFWRDLELRVSEQASDASGNSAFLQDQFYLVAFQEADCGVGRAGAFTKITDAQSNPASW